METDFDPIVFLKIESLIKADDRERTRKIILIKMAEYLIKRFVEDLSEDQFVLLEADIGKLTKAEDVLTTIKKYDPEFENKKIDYLNEYRNNFKFEDLEEQNNDYR